MDQFSLRIQCPPKTCRQMAEAMDLSFAQQVFTFRKATSFWNHLLVKFKDESASSSDSRIPARLQVNQTENTLRT